jgi:glutamate racemase
MAPIGIFDSGVGGLSVLAEFRKLAPGHPVIYLADQAWAPFGERSLVDVRQRSVAITRYLVAQGCGLIVVACNSASAAALHHLRDVFPDQRFVGMEPAVKPAASQSQSGVIGVLATDATFQGELYASVVDRHSNGAEIVEQACPGLADAIERLGVDHPQTLALVDRYVSPLRMAGVDTVVLGCTHYPFLLAAISDAAGTDITVIDPAPAVARQALRVLEHSDVYGDTTFLTTGDAAVFRRQISALIGDYGQPASVDIEPPQAARKTRVLAVVADLTKQEVDVVVNAANTNLQHGGGVAAALARAGGPIVQRESDAWVDRHGPLTGGGAAVTSAGSMPAGNIIHVAGPIYRQGQDNETLLRAAVSDALAAAQEIRAASIALPAISAGVYGYPPTEATAIIADEVVSWINTSPGVFDEVRLVALDPVIADHFERGLVKAGRSLPD